MAGKALWAAVQHCKASTFCVPGAAQGQSQGYIFASRMDHHRAKTTRRSACRFSAAHHKQIIFGPCHKHACVQPTANTAKSMSYLAAKVHVHAVHSVNVAAGALTMMYQMMLSCLTLQDSSELWNHDAIQTTELFQQLRLGKVNCLADNRHVSATCHTCHDSAQKTCCI